MAVVVQWLERATVARETRVRFPPSAFDSFEGESNIFRGYFLVKRMFIFHSARLSPWKHDPSEFYTMIISHKDDLDVEIIEKFRKFYGSEEPEVRKSSDYHDIDDN